MVGLYIQLLAFIWESDYVLFKLGLDPTSEVYRSWFTFLVLVIASTISNIPWSYYKIFVINQKHGFNTMTIKLFITDTIKGLLITVILTLILTPLFIKIMEYGGENFYIYLFIFTVIITFALLWLIPNVIMPLFNKYEELEEGELKSKIYELSDRLKFPLKKLFTVDQSKRSNHSNAFFFGFGSNKRIVLFDNLKKHLETDEIVAVVAHELGHWKMNHTVLHLVFSFANIFMIFYIFSFAIHRDDILIDFGFKKHYNIVSLLVFMEIYSPVSYLTKLIQTFMTRKLEFQADKFAKDLGYEKLLMKGLIRLHIENKANLNPDPLYATYHFSHPELIERLRALGDFYDIITIEELEKKKQDIKENKQNEKEEENKGEKRRNKGRSKQWWNSERKT